MRCFIALDLPKEIIEKIKKIQDALPEFNGKKTEPENLHLTFKFLGEIDKEKIEEIKEKLREIKMAKFESEIDLIGVFSENYIRIIWLHLANCIRLQKEIDNSLKGLFKPEQMFMGHLTIARVKRVDDRKDFLEKLKKIKIPKIKFVVDSFKLKSSILKPKGPIYEDIEVYNIK